LSGQKKRFEDGEEAGKREGDEYRPRLAGELALTKKGKKRRKKNQFPLLRYPKK